MIGSTNSIDSGRRKPDSAIKIEPALGLVCKQNVGVLDKGVPGYD